MRGRELPGFTSARLLISGVSVDLENLRAEVRCLSKNRNNRNWMILFVRIFSEYYFINWCLPEKKSRRFLNFSNLFLAILGKNKWRFLISFILMGAYFSFHHINSPWEKNTHVYYISMFAIFVTYLTLLWLG